MNVVSTNTTDAGPYSIVRTVFDDGSESFEQVPKAGTPDANGLTLRERASQALATNRAYLTQTSPTAAQNAAQVKALTRQTQALIRLLLGQLDGTD